MLRFGWFYGPGAAHSEQLLALARRHVCVQMGRADGYVSSIHMLDGATAVADALAAAARTNVWLRAPGRAALLLGDRSTSLTRSLRVSNRKLRAATNWAPHYPSAREGWLATAAALGERG